MFLVLGLVAAALTFARRFTGAAFCAAAILVLLGLQYAMMLRITALSSIFWSASDGNGQNATVSPVALHAHPDIGFYVIAGGALVIVFAALYGRRNAPVQHVGGGAYAAPETNGHAAIGEPELDRTDRAK